MPLLEPEKKEKRWRGGGEWGGRGKGRRILGELCGSSALSKNVPEPRKMARPAEHPAGRSRYQFSQACCLRYCKHCLILLAAKPGGVHLMHITPFTTIHCIQLNPTNATRHTTERTTILQYYCLMCRHSTPLTGRHI